MTINSFQPAKRSVGVPHVLKTIGMYAVLALFTVLTLFPFYAMLISSFKTFGEAMGEFTWWPKQFTLEAYRYLLGDNPFDVSLWRSLGNTLKIVLPPTIIGLLVSAMSAYTFAKRSFFGRDLMFSLLLATMMLPGVVTMMSQFLIYNALNWIDTPLPLMIPGMFGGATCVFFLRQYMRGIPTDLVEAARIDGMNHPMIFVRVILPLSVPALLAQGILGFVGGYQDYMGPLIYLQSAENETLQITLARFVGISGMTGGQNIPAIMAGAVLTLLPLLLLYIVAQKFFISGIAVSGLKA